jgi:hypothetical protein
MSQSRLHDLAFLLGLSLTACGPEEGDDPDPANADALDAALDACRPFGQAMAACYADEEGYGYVLMVGYCVAQVGYAQQEPACAAAYGDLFACLAEADCEVFLGDDADDGEEGPEASPCAPEEQALEEACESLFGVDQVDEDEG